MKKILCLVLLALGLTFNGNAQTKKTPDAAPAQKHVRKADGSFDMRYKANKEMARKKAKGPVKKDGTPDKRYRENRTQQKTP